MKVKTEMATKTKKKTKKSEVKSEHQLKVPSQTDVARVKQSSPAPLQTKRLLPHNLLSEIDQLREKLDSLEKDLVLLKSKMLL